MDSYYNFKQYTDALEQLINAKEKEIEEHLRALPDDISKRVRQNQLECELQELVIQKTYYENLITDMMLNRCKGCQTCTNCRW